MKPPSLCTYSSSSNSRSSIFLAVVNNLNLCHGFLGLAPCDRSTFLSSSLPLVIFTEVMPEFVISQRTFSEANALRRSGCGGSKCCLELTSPTALTVMRGAMFVLSVRPDSWCWMFLVLDVPGVIRRCQVVQYSLHWLIFGDRCCPFRAPRKAFVAGPCRCSLVRPLLRVDFALRIAWFDQPLFFH